jgi:hypothetical protein
MSSEIPTIHPPFSKTQFGNEFSAFINEVFSLMDVDLSLSFGATARFIDFNDPRMGTRSLENWVKNELITPSIPNLLNRSEVCIAKLTQVLFAKNVCTTFEEVRLFQIENLAQSGLEHSVGQKVLKRIVGRASILDPDYPWSLNPSVLKRTYSGHVRRK